MGQRQADRRQRVAQTRHAIGVVSDVGGAIVTLSMIGAASVGFLGVILGIARDETGIALFGGGVVFGVGLGAALIYAASARAANSVEAQRGYRWVEATYTYEIDATDPHVHTQTVDVEIKAIRDGVRAFTNQYRWSGNGVDTGPVVTSHGHSLSGPSRRALGWRSYVVTLDPALKKGQHATIQVRQQLNDDVEAFDPYLAKTVHETMEQLTLRVRLPRRLKPLLAWQVVRDGVGPEGPEVDRGQPDVTADGRGHGWLIEWLVCKPVVGLTYELYWGYRDGCGIYDVAVHEEADPQP
jgi:hypothetical protein